MATEILSLFHHVLEGLHLVHLTVPHVHELAEIASHAVKALIGAETEPEEEFA